LKLYFFEGPNFGDALNEYLLPKIYPNFFDEDDSTLFVGIGSLLNDSFPREVRKIVFGSGYAFSKGYGVYSAPPKLDGKWKIYCVRGPNTARVLGLGPDIVAGDSAILINKFRRRQSEPKHKFSLMPHWVSLRDGNWERVAAELGLHLIDPRWPVERVLNDLEDSGVVITEAMHGAITADALRIPWIALKPVENVNRLKWYDWAEALDIQLRPERLSASSVQEALAAFSARYTRWLRGGIRFTGAASILDIPFMAAAQRHLENAMRAEPMLSSDSALDRVVDKLETAALNIKRDFA